MSIWISMAGEVTNKNRTAVEDNGTSFDDMAMDAAGIERDPEYRQVGPQHGYHYRDSNETEGPSAPYVEVHDHSSSNPSNWNRQQWLDAIKRDPEKYTRLFAEMAARGDQPGGLSEDVRSHLSEIQPAIAQAMQDFNRNMALLKSIQDANHETLKALATFRV